MSAAIEGPGEWVISIVLIALILFMIWMTVAMTVESRRGVTNDDLTVSDCMFRLAIEGQLLALGVPSERAVDEARDLFERHRESPVTDESFAELHDDIARTAGAWA